MLFSGHACVHVDFFWLFCGVVLYVWFFVALVVFYFWFFFFCRWVVCWFGRFVGWFGGLVLVVGWWSLRFGGGLVLFLGCFGLGGRMV